jgi:uncharacterized protein
MTPLHAVLYALLGFAVGTLGTLIGAGGGFILLPLLVLLHPQDSAATLTAISLSVVCANAMSGSFAYARMRRIDYRSALAFAAAGLPGSIIGAWATKFLDRRLFDPLLGVMLIAGALVVLLRPAQNVEVTAEHATRTLVEKDGTVHAYSPRLGLGILISLGVGFLSSLLGIGGGIIHVPAMVYVLGFPTHVATATSHAVLAVLSLAGVIVHWRDGTLGPALARIVPIAVGVLLGAQLGAWLSSRIHGRWIMRSLAIALISVGVRLLFAH